MKKVLSVFLAVTLLLSMSVTAFAVDTNTAESQRTVVQDGYSFIIGERTNANYSVTRTYTKSPLSERRGVSLEETKALLVALGMDDNDVEALSTETLMKFANSPQIIVTKSYTKFDEENGTATSLPEATAIAEANALIATQEAELLQKAQTISVRGFIDNESNVPGHFKDSYMEITHAAAPQGDGAYLFTVDAEWLTMPFFRGYDSIGSCAMNGTVTPNTREGHYSYTMTIIDSFGRISHSNSGDIDITNMQNDIEGNWYGSAGVFNLPNDVSNEYTTITYSNFEAHYQYEGHVNYPDLVSWFNSVGTYDHATISIDLSPSISIDIGGDVSASIGLSMVASIDSRPAEIEVNHIP